MKMDLKKEEGLIKDLKEEDFKNQRLMTKLAGKINE